MEVRKMKKIFKLVKMVLIMPGVFVWNLTHWKQREKFKRWLAENKKGGIL